MYKQEELSSGLNSEKEDGNLSCIASSSSEIVPLNGENDIYLPPCDAVSSNMFKQYFEKSLLPTFVIFCSFCNI